MSWTDHAIAWHVYPLGFTGAAIRPTEAERTLTHRLGHLTAWLDHVVELGTNVLLLGPVFESDTHGYDTLDHYRIDPRLGDDADFDALVAAADARGVRVVLDGVFNHVSDRHPAYLQALERGPESHEAHLFRIDWSQRPPRAEVFEGHGSLVRLNHDDPAVAGWVGDVMLHWLRRGVAGWRLDAAYAVDPAFWAGIIARLREEFPDAWFLGEVIHGDYSGYVAASHLDSVTQYELWKATWSSLRDGNFFELAWSLQRHNDFLGHFLPQTFVGNHDVTRIATTVGPQSATLALVLLATVGGVPSIYAGDEFGFLGTKTETWGGDDVIRPMFPATPAEITAGRDMLDRHRAALALRRRYPWLQHARTEQVELANRDFTYDAVGPQGQRLRVRLALDPAPWAEVRDGDAVVLSVQG